MFALREEEADHDGGDGEVEEEEEFSLGARSTTMAILENARQ